VSSGQRITNPEDDPAAFGRVMGFDADSKAVAQYQKNISLLKDQATASAAAINSLKTVSDRASEIATMADGTKSPAQLKIYAAEVTQLIQQAAQSANSQYGGAYILAGTATDQPPFQVTTDAQGLVQQVAYQGNAGENNVEIDQGVTVSAAPPGVNTTNSGSRGLLADTRTGADFFQHLIDLQNHLQSGDSATISSTDHANLSNDEENILYHISANGAMQSRLEASASVMTTRASALNQSVSKDADADLTDTITRLSQAQTAYSAALQTGAKLLSTSLLDYLK
jgi:flagellar hook-associated protein 3 FlgL